MNYYVIFFEKGVPSIEECVHPLTHKRENYAEHHFMHCRDRRPRLSVYKIFVEQTGRRGRRPLRKSKKLTPNHLHLNTPKMRVFYEHFCRNDSSNIIFTTQNSLLLLSEFSASRSVLPRSFFLLFASIFLLSFAKEGRKTRNLYKKKY